MRIDIFEALLHHSLVRAYLLAFIALLLLAGCYQRSYRIPRVTRDAIHFNPPADQLQIDGEPWKVQEEECAFQLPGLVLSRADVVRVVENLFKEHPEGDAIINAELYMFHLPLILWDDSCVGIRGEMVKVKTSTISSVK